MVDGTGMDAAWLLETVRAYASAQAEAAHLLVMGVNSSDQRARLLKAGCSDALPSSVGLEELALRAARVTRASGSLPRVLNVGPLELDLFHRDARVQSAWLSLHPREFALLWRLAECPGERVTRRQLLTDVWRLRHEPDTNSVEVHVSRLRNKLAAAGLSGLVATDPAGGYRLSLSVLSDEPLQLSA